MKKPKPKTHLLTEDLLQMQLRATELKRARAQHQANQLKAEVQKLRHQNQMAEMQLTHLLTQQTWQEQAKVNDQVLAAAEEEQRVFAADIGKRYAVDWKTTAYDPETGQLVPVAQD